VFGLLGLPTTDTISKSIVPDYSKSMSQVYLELARKIIESASSLLYFPAFSEMATLRMVS
jgi:hypothetical protein